MRISKLPLLLSALALIFASACVSTDTTEDTAIEASADTGDADYEPLHGWPKSN